MKQSPKLQTPPPVTDRKPPDAGEMDAEQFAALKTKCEERKIAAQACYYRLKNDIRCGYLLHRDIFSHVNGKLNGVYQSQFLVLSETLPGSYGQSLARAAAKAGKKKDRDGNPCTQSSAVLKISEIINDAGYKVMGNLKKDMLAWIETISDDDIA
jgi:hypothetical protein